MIYSHPFPYLGFESLEIETEDESLALLNALPSMGLGIVGTRHPQHKSFELLEKTIQDLAYSQLVIVSGFARGIDSRAHELAIEHGLKTVAIVGCGLNIDYPKENRQLRKKIIDHGGMIISPFERNTPAYPQNFLNRNQLIAYYSQAVWVVEAAAISGTLNTAFHAGDLNRDLYATPSFPDDPFYEGNQNLLSQKKTDRYPLAEPFFGVHTLSKTWFHLDPKPQTRKKTDLKSLSRIQRWIHEIRRINGVCQVQTLMNLAISNGVTPGQFYLEYERELNAGLFKEDSRGRVCLG